MSINASDTILIRRAAPGLSANQSFLNPGSENRLRPIVSSHTLNEPSQPKINFTAHTNNFLTVNKRKINQLTNYSASAVCGLSFILANAGAPEVLKKATRYLGFGLTSFATASSGVVNAHSAIQGKNVLAAIGAGAEIPTSIAAIGKNLWLFRGIPLFGQNQQLIFSNLETRDENNERTTGIKMDTLFKNTPGWKGYMDGLKIMVLEMPHIAWDFIRNPKKAFTNSPHVVFLSTTSQLIGAALALFGFEKIGAGFRNVGAVGVDVGCGLHELNTQVESDDSASSRAPKPIIDKLKNASDYCLAGVVWGAAAFIDFFKRFDFISNKIQGLSELEYVFDRAATAFFNSGNDKAANKNKTASPA